jgi:inosine/xanthosine triphosphate pyrophosphatase family protein
MYLFYPEVFMNLSKLKLVTSNKHKLNEFRRFGLTLEMSPGLDLKEVSGTSKQVILHKALEAGNNLLVEDTILTINGVEVVDIRAKINELNNQPEANAVWTVSLAALQDDNVYTASASIKGTIKVLNRDIPKDAFGFDPYFLPDGHPMKLSLYDLEKQGQKDLYSARKQAIINFINQTGDFSTTLKKDIKKWEGEYQSVK